LAKDTEVIFTTLHGMQTQSTGFVQILEKSGKSLNLM